MKKITLFMMLQPMCILVMCQQNSLSVTAKVNVQNGCYYDVSSRQVFALEVYELNGKKFCHSCGSDVPKELPPTYIPSQQIWHDPCGCEVPKPGSLGQIKPFLKMKPLNITYGTLNNMIAVSKIKSADEDSVKLSFDNKQEITVPTRMMISSIQKMPGSTKASLNSKVREFLKDHPNNSSATKMMTE